LLYAVKTKAESIQPVVAEWPENQPIALCFSNCPEFVVTFLALAWNGIPAIPIVVEVLNNSCCPAQVTRFYSSANPARTG
jgi:acyl-CoA synthetase (AMP-forming)/AMP-acid ligase II